MNPSFALAWHSAGKIPVRTEYDGDTAAPSFYIEVAVMPDYAIEHRRNLDSLPYIAFDAATGMAVYTVEYDGHEFEVTYKAIDQRELEVLLLLEDVSLKA